MFLKIAILIKSSRRPWCLDRLLESLRLNLVNFDSYQVVVADDRTEPKHLARIKEKFPRVDILTTPNLQNSPRAFISNWIRAVRSMDATHVLVLEDDQWLTRSLDLSEILSRMVNDGIQVLSINHGVSGLPPEWVQRIDEHFVHCLPPSIAIDAGSLRTRMRVFFLTPKSWLGLKYVSALTLVSKRFQRAYSELSGLNPICGAIFTKSLWLAIWPANQSAISENIQVRRTFLAIGKKEASSSFLAIHQLSFFRTSHVSSISGLRRSSLDWVLLNSLWSKKWFDGQLVMPSSNDDWDEVRLAELVRDSVSECALGQYLQWVSEFRAIYGSKSHNSNGR